MQVRSTLFVHFFDIVLHDYNVKLPSSFYVGKCMCSPMFCRVPVHFFFYTVAHFHLVGRLFSFSHRHFHVFPPTKFVSCFLSNALAMLSMSLKTLKFSRTWLCCWFFSLLSPDGLSLTKKSRWIKVSRRKTPCCICHTCWLSYSTLVCLWCGRACVCSRDYLCTVNQNSYPWCTTARAWASQKIVVVNQDVKNAKIDLCHAAAILSQEI